MRKFERQNARRVAEDGKKPRERTVRQLIERHVERHGVPPSDEYISMILGCSLQKVRRYRGKAAE